LNPKGHIFSDVTIAKTPIKALERQIGRNPPTPSAGGCQLLCGSEKTIKSNAKILSLHKITELPSVLIGDRGTGANNLTKAGKILNKKIFGSNQFSSLVDSKAFAVSVN